MAQRKSTPASKSTAAKSAAAKSAAAKKTTGARPTGQSSRSSQSRPAESRSTQSRSTQSQSTGGRPPTRKPGKSIVNQKQTPWGLIATTAAIVVFAAAIVIVVVATHKSGPSGKFDHTTLGGQEVNKNNTYTQPEWPAAKAIKGVTYRVEGQHTHQEGTIKYDASPPIGGNHNQIWADCAGNVYTHQLANENAVHMLEHGAVWITYNPDKIKGAQLTTLKKYVAGVDRMALSPYAGLKTPISMQAWGYQLFLSSPSDPRIAQFIKALKYNPKTTPENASCTDPYWDASKSTFGHPYEGPNQ